MENNKKLFLSIVTLILIIMILQLYFSGLSYDEAYYWVYSQYPSWGYYDHPPMVGWLIYLGTLFGKNELMVRLPFFILSLGGLFLLYDLTNKMNKIFFVILALSFPLFHGVGFFALPDTGQFFFGILYFWVLKKYLSKDSFKISLFLGLTIALLLYSKYHGILLIFFTLAAHPRLCVKKSFWLVFTTGLILFLPHLWWQYQHDFISVVFHLSKRAGRGLDVFNILEYIVGVFVLAGGLASIIYFKSLKENPKDEFEKIIKFNIVGISVFFLIMSFKGRTEANWTLSIYPLLLIWVSNHLTNVRKLVIYSSPLLFILIILRVGIFVDHQGFILKRFGELEKWHDISQEIKNYCKGLKIGTDTYQQASKLSFYMDEMIPAFHIKGRSSQFELIKSEQNYQDQEQICFVSNKERWGGEKFMINYKGPLWVNKTHTYRFWMDKKKNL